MKFTCTTNNLKRVIGIAERFTGKNITLPVLVNILLEFNQGTLCVVATNLEYAIQITTHGSGVGEARICVPARVLSLFIQTISDEKVQIEEKQGGLLIKTETRDTRIHGVSPDEFPLIPKIKKTHSITLPIFVFCNGIERVLPAVSLSEFKPELAGIFVAISPTSVKLAATDTFRLAEQTIPIESKKQNNSFSFIIPYRISQEIAHALNNGDNNGDEITISIGENQLLLEADGCVIISRLIEGNFPEYGGIIPRNFETSCFVGKDLFINSVRASSIFASKLQEVTTSIKSRNLEIKSLNQDIGEYKNIIPCAPSGKDIDIGFNYKYLLDGLQAINEDEVFFGLNGEQSPSLIKNKSDNSFLYVVMPIRLS